MGRVRDKEETVCFSFPCAESCLERTEIKEMKRFDKEGEPEIPED